MARPRTTDVFRAFTDERRLRILHLLRDGEMCVNDLVTVLGLSQPTVSRQLGVLRRARLVETRQDGPWRHYRVAENGSPLHSRLLSCLAQCFTEVPALRKDATRAARLRRKGGCCPPS